MFYDFTVLVPETNRKITKQKGGRSVYINYEYSRVYNKEKKTYELPQT